MTTRGAAFAALLAESHAKVVGEPLVPEGMSGDAAADWLYDAPFGLLAHDTSADPLFVYANRMAQERFGYTWDEFVGLPSRLSAGGQAREERRVFMESSVSRSAVPSPTSSCWTTSTCTGWNAVTWPGFPGSAAITGSRPSPSEFHQAAGGRPS